MAKVTCDMSMSIDGFVSGLGQTAEKPFGEARSGTDLVTHVSYRVTRPA